MLVGGGRGAQVVLKVVHEDLDASQDGLVPVATCLLIEILRQSKNRNPLGLPVSYITRRLKDSIDEFRVRLSSDFSGYGAQWQDGLLGELRHLSGLVRRRGGIEFEPIERAVNVPPEKPIRTLGPLDSRIRQFKKRRCRRTGRTQNHFRQITLVAIRVGKLESHIEIGNR